MAKEPKETISLPDSGASAVSADLAAAETDTRDAEIAELRRQLEEARRPVPEDARDATIAALRAELDEIRSTPDGAAGELARALAALQAQVDRMATGAGLVPLPESQRPDPYLYGAVLATGEVVKVQHPHATHHFSPQHRITTRVVSYFELQPDEAELLSA